MFLSDQTDSHHPPIVHTEVLRSLQISLSSSQFPYQAPPRRKQPYSIGTEHSHCLLASPPPHTHPITPLLSLTQLASFFLCYMSISI